MPFGSNCEFSDFEACKAKMRGKVGDADAYCAALMRRTEEHCKTFPDGKVNLSLEAIRQLCPACAEKMEALNLTALKLSFDELKTVLQKAPQNLDQLCGKVGGDPGVFTRCMDMVGGWELVNPEGFCEWLHEQCTGHTPAEDSLEGATKFLALIRDVESEIREQELQALEAYRKGMAPAPVLYKASGQIQKAMVDDTITFVASDETEDRQGDVLKSDGWVLDQYQRNPVYLYGHDHTIPPIGTVPKVWVEKGQLLNTVKWDEADEFAKFIKGKYQRGVMKGQSVGFIPLAFKPRAGRSQGIEFEKQELLEISAVAVPAHPAAVQRSLGGRHFPMLKSVIVANEDNNLQERILELLKGVHI